MTMKQTMKEVLEGVKVLKGWRNIEVLPEIEEKIDDISFIVEYSRYGDEYLVIGTRDGRTYEYGCYANLKFEPHNYLRKPVLHITEIEGHVEKNGISGKIEKRSDYIIADKLIFAYKNGIKLKPEDILEYLGADDWDTEQYMILLNEI